jgi:hypothetical protein
MTSALPLHLAMLAFAGPASAQDPSCKVVLQPPLNAQETGRPLWEEGGCLPAERDLYLLMRKENPVKKYSCLPSFGTPLILPLRTSSIAGGTRASSLGSATGILCAGKSN